VIDVNHKPGGGC